MVDLILSQSGVQCHIRLAAMDAWLFLSTLALLWGPVHVYLTKRDLVDLKEWVGWVNQHPD